MTHRNAGPAAGEERRVVVVSGPPGFDPAAALFSEGVILDETDVIVTRQRRGNVDVEVWDGSPNAS